MSLHFFFQAEDGIRDDLVTGVQTCALPISRPAPRPTSRRPARRTAAPRPARRAGARRRPPTRPPAACRCRLPRRRQARLSRSVALRASIPERRLLEATVGHEPGHVARRRDVEGGIERGSGRRRDAPPRDRLYLVRAALLDRYSVPVGERPIDGR